MKYLLPLLLIFGCASPKEKIVDQQRAIKAQATAIEKRIEERKAYLDNNYKNISVPEFAGREHEINKMYDSVAALRGVYDSLEFELKKY